MIQSDYKPIKYLIEQAQYHPASALPLETHQSYPIPILGREGLQVIFLYCSSFADAEVGLQLLPPSYIALLDAKTGTFEQMKRTTPKELGRSDNPSEYMGVYAMPQGMTAEEFVLRQERLYVLYDLMMPLFAAGQTRVSPDAKKLIYEFTVLFDQITEPPLQPYYRESGKDFFRWLDQAGR